jgi:hypothetical protein
MSLNNILSCQAYTPEASNPFGYQRFFPSGIAFLALFFLSSSTHAIQTFHYKTW